MLLLHGLIAKVKYMGDERMKLSATAVVLVALLALAPCAFAAEKASAAAPLETPAFCPAVSSTTPVASLFAARGQEVFSMGCSPEEFEACGYMCDDACGEEFGYCSTDCVWCHCMVIE